ncbi:MAG: glycosyltransferase family 4 protein [Sphingobacteriales bacterium]|nr:glycosyltransferase family 4 protein [Sphingobacteriales bacterium]MBI3718025.1 glycosyltransferase family 4 protein [Sphingobacteriales bacterium]
MKPAAIFISNKIYFDELKKEGGVRVCTQEYLSLIRLLYEVTLFPVAYNINFSYRLRVKLGLNIYNDYKPGNFKQELADIIRKQNIKVVFLNMSNTAAFAPLIKKQFGKEIKIILCSHGNESGDFLHETTRFKKRIPFYKTLLSSYALGRMLKKEAMFRQGPLDAVLTVSPIEEALEKWMGAKKVLMIPRTIERKDLNRNPVCGRVGFIGDLSHWPNFFGIDMLCQALSSVIKEKSIEVRVVGSPSSVGESLAIKYPFVHYTGYLNNEELKQEVAAWAFFLNPVFYYSRGVSTKLARALEWGLPVITTSIGCRGYIWKQGNPVFAETPEEMARKICESAVHQSAIQKASLEIEQLIASAPSLETISDELKQLINNIK